MSNIEIIIARFNEDLKWTVEGIFNNYKYVVYNKGDNDNFIKTNVIKIIHLKNVGRCDHTYLYHIVKNYNNLANITVFFPGSLNLECKKDRAIEILTRINNNNNNVSIFVGEYSENIKNKFNDFQLENWCSTNIENFTINSENKLSLSNIRPYGKWYNHFFGNKVINIFCYWGIFSVDKRDILQHPIKRYITFLNQVNIHSNPEIGHYLERSWCAIFSPMRYTKIFLKPYT